jgi:acetyl-CoA synthetase (ADP-forming)
MEQSLLEALEGIFRPRSVALVGVSEREYNLGYRWVKSLLDAGFPIVYPVNPKGGELLGLKVYPTVGDIPGEVDLAILLIPREAVPDVARDCAQKRTKGIVLYTSGFGETGPEGKELERQIVKIARAGGTRVIGPSCLGPYNPSVKLITQYPFPRKAGAVGVISHSGFLFNYLVSCVAATGIGPSKGISCGSDCDLSFVDFLEYLGQDEQTRIIVAYLEGIKDGKRLLSVGRDVSRNKPIVIMKGGDTEVGREASASHTGTLAVPSAIWKTLCRQTGIISVDSFEQMMDTLIALYYLPRPKGRRVAVITAPGGIAVTATDACIKLGLELPRLSEQTRALLANLIGTLGTNLKNPVDLGPMGAMAAENYVKEAMRIVARDENIDMLLVSFIGPRTTDDVKDAKSAEALLAAIKEGGKPTVFSGASLQGWDRGELKFLRQSNVPVYPEARRAAFALSRLAEYSEFARSAQT